MAFEEDYDPELSPFTGEFVDPATESRFREEQRQETVRQAQFLFSLSAGICMALLAYNILLPASPGAVINAIPPRSAAILASLASFFVVGQLRQSLVHPLLLAWAAILTISAALLVGIQTHLAVFPVLILPACLYIAMPTWFVSTVLTGVGSTVTMLAAYYLSEPDPGLFVRAAMGAGVVSAILIAYRSRSGRRLRLIWAGAQAHRQALNELAESRRLQERIFKAVPVPLIITDVDSGTVTRANEAAEGFLQVPEGKLAGRKIGEFFRNEKERGAIAREILRAGLKREMPIEVTRSDGETRAVLLSASLMEDERGNGTSVVAGVMDITDQKRQERQTRAAEQEYRDLFQNAVVGIYRSLPDGKMLRANPALVRFNGYETEDELITAVNDISEEWYVKPGRREEWLRLMREHGRVTDFVSEVYRHKTRERVWISENSWTVYDANGNTVCFEGTLVEATDRKRLEEKVEHMALHDQLTGLGNRRLLTERLEQACTWVERHGGYFSVMCLDLDEFKAVNDIHGHTTGDLLLQEAAQRLKQSCRAEDTVTRIGGDEFIVLSVGIGYPARLSRVAERIAEAFREPFRLDGAEVVIGISIGIAIAPLDGLDSGELLAKADKALYGAKKEGRNRYRFFNESVLAQSRETTLLTGRKTA